MQKIDRLGWAAGMAVEAFGVKLGIRVNTPEVLEAIPEYLPPGWQAMSGPEPVVDHLCSLIMGGSGTRRGVKTYNILYSGSWRAVRSLKREEVFRGLARALDFQVALQAPRHVFVHAGVVGWKDSAILIPGRSRSGKTTLVKVLVEAGAIYYSDEYAALDEAGRVFPWPRPLNIRTEETGNGPGTPTPIETFGGTPGIKPLPVGWIVDTAYKPGAIWQPEALSPVQAALCLLDNTLIAKLDPRRALPVLRQAALGAHGIRSARGEAKAAANQLLSLPMISYKDRDDESESKT